MSSNMHWKAGKSLWASSLKERLIRIFTNT